MKKENKNMNERKVEKALAINQIIIMIISSFAFAFIVGGMAVLSSESVSAANVGEYWMNNGQKFTITQVDANGNPTKIQTSNYGEITLKKSSLDSTFIASTSDGDYSLRLTDLRTTGTLSDSLTLGSSSLPSTLTGTPYDKIPLDSQSVSGLQYEYDKNDPTRITPSNAPLVGARTLPTNTGNPANANNPVVIKNNTPTNETPTKFSFIPGVGKGWDLTSASPFWAASNMLEGVVWAAAVLVFVNGLLSQILPEKQQQLIKPLGQAIAGGIMTYKTVYGLLTQKFGEKQLMTPGSTWAYGTSIAVAGIVAYLIFANQYKKLKEREASIEFKCLPWQAPLGGKDCSKCNEDSLKPCSEYRCKSLGQTCKLINPATGFERCIDSSPNDVTSPGIKPWLDVLTNGYKYTDVQDRPPNGEGSSSGHMRIVDASTGGCLKAFTPFEFGITTTDKETSSSKIVTQPAQCKIDFNHTAKFDDMGYYLADNNLYIENHTQRISMPGTDLLNKTFPEIKNNGEYTLYIRCQDGNGNENRDEFAVRFCIDKSKDATAPLIQKTSIPSGSPVLYKIDNLSVMVYTNEPSNCRWDRKSVDYNQMTNSMACTNNVWDMNAELLYGCNAQLTSIKDDSVNEFYFKCQDLSNNTMAQSYKYTLIGTKPLNILSVGPEGTIGSSTSTAVVNLSVKTDNGYKNGESTCYYSRSGIEKDYIAMFDTGTNTHKQNLDLIGGNYTYYFKCVDAGGNADYNKTNFNVFVDKFAPVVSRMYIFEGKIIVITNEESLCSYSTNSCNFKIEEGTNMPIDSTINHYADWKTEQNYYIKCKDQFGNEPNPTDCSVTIRAYDLPSEDSE
jgi:hypothetical protein